MKNLAYLGSFNTDNAIQTSSRVIKEGHVNSCGGSRYPRSFSFWINVKHMSFACKDGLFATK